MAEQPINPDMWLEKLSQSKLYKLAQRNLIRKNKVNKNTHGAVNFYEFDPAEVIIEGLKIIQKANRARIRI